MRPNPGTCGLALSLFLATTGCGGGPPRVLESISVTSETSQSGTTFTASGHYNTAPESVSGIPVAWFQTGVAVDPPGPNWDFTLNNKPMTGQCFDTGQAVTYTVVAYAPENPNASAAASMPFSVFMNLVERHSMPTEDGFVAGTAQFSCPATDPHP
jgi:hypothetical protein